MSLVHCRADSPPKRYAQILNREARIAATTWAHEPASIKDQRLIDAANETRKKGRP